MRRLVLPLAVPLLLTAVGCDGAGQSNLDIGTIDPTRPAGGPAVEVVEGAPGEGALAERAVVEVPEPALALSNAHGRIVVGTASGVLLQDGIGLTKLNPLPVASEEGEPTGTGEVWSFARRAGGGVLLAASQGLFHDHGEQLLRSPLTHTLVQPPRWLHSRGEGALEELWLVPEDASTDPRVLRVADGKLWTVRLTGVKAAPDLVLGLSAGVALIAQGGALYEVDAGAGTATVVAEQLGEVSSADRAADGTAYVAAASGLWVRSRDGALSRHTLANPGEPPAPVRGVTAAYGEVYVATDAAVIRFDGAPTRVATRSASATAPVALAGNGDLWMTDQGALVRLLTGTQVSFEAEVKPFFAAHCTSCHSAVASGAPQFELTDLEVARTRAALIVKRLLGDGAPPMPPQSAEILGASDYSVVLRWAAGGMNP